MPLVEYRDHLPRIVDRLKATARTLIWASTTPVIFERHAAAKDFDRREEDVVAYNAAAAEVMAAAGVETNDLYSAVMAAGPARCLGKDGVHFTDDGYAMLGQAVASSIRTQRGD